MTQNPFSLEGETAVITGGGTGLGLGIASAFVHAGARVVLVGRRADVLERAANSLGERATFQEHDVDQLNQSDEFIRRVTERVGDISILVNNAGIHLKKLAVDTTSEEFEAVLRTHVLAAFSLTRAVLLGMIQRRHGNVLFTASMASVFGIPQVIAYSAAKSAYLGIVRTLATEVSQHGVGVNAVAPGWIDSDIMRRALSNDPKRAERVLERTPMQRYGEPADIGNAAVYLCSPAAKFVTGVVLPVDGGISIGF